MLLDDILNAAPDIDHAILLGEMLGWRVFRVEGPVSGGRWWVMLEGPSVPHLSSRYAHAPEVLTGHIFSNASFKSFYGAILLALLAGVHRHKASPLEVAIVAKPRKSAA